jgi:hypothetical protein
MDRILCVMNFKLRLKKILLKFQNELHEQLHRHELKRQPKLREALWHG